MTKNSETNSVIDRDSEFQSRTAVMIEELRNADPLFQPARFWEGLNEMNNNDISRDGFNNFKRTINGNYFNWVPSDFTDNQLCNLLSWWSKNMNPVPLMLEMPGNESFRFFNAKCLETAEQRYVYKFFVGLLWSFVMYNDPKNLTRRLTEPSIGNPLPITLQGRLISQDLANSIREFYVSDFPIELVYKPTIAELGAGYGRLGFVYTIAHPCRYLIFDIPPALAVSERYLSAVLPDKRIFRFRHFDNFSEVQSEINDCDVGFFTSNQLALFPASYFDLSISISALHEMYIPQIKNYLMLLSRTTKTAIYTKNWKRANNPHNNTDIDHTTYNPGSDWRAFVDREDLVQNAFMEKLFISIRNKNGGS
jgi:putative sugar O-methyltransferase